MTFISETFTSSLRDHFIAAALSNPALVTGRADERRLAKWFGERTGITREEIAARQAIEYAEAAVAALEAESGRSAR